MDIIKLKGMSFAANTYVLIAGSEAAVVDPAVDINLIRNSLGNAELRYILLTHGHFDHILKLDELRSETHAEVCIHRADAEMPGDPSLNASQFFGMDFAALAPNRLLEDGDVIKLGSETIKVIATPGHTPGSVCYDCGNDLVCGDTLFSSGYGRYDLPGGDGRTLFASLSMLAERRDDPTIHPGHGESCNLASADIITAIRNKNYYKT